MTRFLNDGVVHAQMQDICSTENCEGLTDLIQYDDYWSGEINFTDSVVFAIDQEHIGSDLDGAYDDLQGGQMEVGLTLWESNGYLEADIAEDVPIHFKLYFGDSEGDFDAPASQRVDQRITITMGRQNDSRTQPNRTFDGVSCEDKPQIYSNIFKVTLIAAASSFFGAGIGAIKGCSAAVVAGAAGYIGCVLGTASGAAIVGGAVAFGIQMLRMQHACSGKLVADPNALREPRAGLGRSLPMPSQ